MRSIDYGWIIAVIAVVLIAVCWKPIMGMFHAAEDKVNNKPKYEAGKKVFYNPEQWLGAGSYKSCAMCHAADFKAEGGKKIEMKDYHEGKPIILKDVREHLAGNNLGTDDEIIDQINRCLTMVDRIGCGGFSRNAPFMDDLIFYVKAQ